MPYSIKAFKRGTKITFTGKVTVQDIHDANQLVWETENWDRHRFQICDYSQTTDLDLKEGDINQVAALDSASALTNPELKMAIVVQKDEIRTHSQHYQKLMMQKTNLEWDICIHDTLSEAEQWIDDLTPSRHSMLRAG